MPLLPLYSNLAMVKPLDVTPTHTINRHSNTSKQTELARVTNEAAFLQFTWSNDIHESGKFIVPVMKATPVMITSISMGSQHTGF